MVYHEIALEPESIEDLKDLGLIDRMFGFEHGRLIAVFPAKPKETGSWGELLLRHLRATLPPEKHMEIGIRIEQMLKKLMWRSRNSSKLEDGQEWFDLATKEHDTEGKSFACLIGKGERAHPDWVPFQKLYAPDNSVPACLSGPIHFGDAMKDPKTFLAELEPLLFSANRISFIDPHFNPVHPDKENSYRWRATAEKLANSFIQAKRLTADISFHTGYDREVSAKFVSSDAFVQSIATAISKFFPATTTLSVTAWSKKPDGIPFHARYLITDKAGVALDYGSDLGANRRTDVALMPLEFAKKRLKEFEKGDESPFAWKASVQVHGRR
jgi:hypothetical protein